MDWAARRKWTVISILASIGIATVAIISFAIFYEVPTCFDKKQNQDEEGIDCGGPCNAACSASVKPATVRFARALVQSGRTDLIAYIDNPNQDAAGPDTRMTVQLYAEDGQVVERNILIDVPAGRTVPVYLPGIASGIATRQAFMSFAEGYPRWQRSSSAPLTAIAQGVQVEEGVRPRVTATLYNQTAYVQRDVALVVSVFDAGGTVIAASQTIVPTLPPQGTAPATFTWNEPFSAPPVRVEVVAVPMLPQVAP